MKKTTITATPLSWKVFVLSGCTALAVSIAAVGQATQSDRDRPLNDRATSPGITNQNQNQNHQTFEGKIKPLFKVLSEESDSATAGLPQSDPTARPGSITSPGSASQQPGSSRQPADAAQRGANPQDRPAGGITPTPSTGSLNQPLALVCDSKMEPDTKPGSSSTSSTSSSSPQGNPTSERGAGAPATASRGLERSADRVTGASAVGEDEGQVYVLVFDPANPQSRTAYQMAQAIANSQHSGAAVHASPGASGTSSTSTTPADRQQRERDQLQPGASAQRRASDHPAPVSATSSGTDAGVPVKVTGELIERDGIQAIAVYRVDRQHGTDTIRSTQPYQGGQ